jgi:hypothetical protein
VDGKQYMKDIGRIPWRSLLVGIYMGLAAWGGVEGGTLSGLLPQSLTSLLNLPAFVAAALLSGNAHAPNAIAFGVFSFLQWSVTAHLVGTWLKYAHAPTVAEEVANVPDNKRMEMTRSALANGRRDPRS